MEYVIRFNNRARRAIKGFNNKRNDVLFIGMITMCIVNFYQDDGGLIINGLNSELLGVSFKEEISESDFEFVSCELLQ